MPNLNPEEVTKRNPSQIIKGNRNESSAHGQRESYPKHSKRRSLNWGIGQLGIRSGAIQNQSELGKIRKSKELILINIKWSKLS
jgi:hypothetical protein